jgi:hypothetical protein
MNAKAHFLSTSLFQMFLNLIRNDRKGMQAPIESLESIMNEDDRFYINQMTSCTFVGNKEKLIFELQEFI